MDTTVIVSIDQVGLTRPIDFVRLLREFGDFGLKEGKELLDTLVETLTICVVFSDVASAKHFVAGCQSLGLSAQLASQK